MLTLLRFNFNVRRCGKVTYCILYRVAWKTVILTVLLTSFFGLTEKYAGLDNDMRVTAQEEAEAEMFRTGDGDGVGRVENMWARAYTRPLFSPT